MTQSPVAKELTEQAAKEISDRLADALMVTISEARADPKMSAQEARDAFARMARHTFVQLISTLDKEGVERRKLLIEQLASEFENYEGPPLTGHEAAEILRSAITSLLQ